MKTLKRIAPALVLFLLAPMIGEMLSGSAPPAEFFDPFGILLLGILYGGGAILVRELTLQWDKGWPTILTLGAAYGIIEEGLMVKSFFDPNWMDLDILGSYGRWAGVNWVWSLELTIFHAVFSIAIPILLVSLLFPDRQREPWIRRRAFHWLCFVFMLNGIFIYFALTTYKPPALHYTLTTALVIGLIFLSRRLPKALRPTRESPPLSPRGAIGLGFLGTLGFFLLNWVLPHTQIPALITMALVIVLAASIGRKIQNAPGLSFETLNRIHWALASGAIGFFILIAPIQEFDDTRADNTAGMTLVGLTALIFLFWLGRRLKQKAGTAALENTPPERVNTIL